MESCYGAHGHVKHQSGSQQGAPVSRRQEPQKGEKHGHKGHAQELGAGAHQDGHEHFPLSGGPKHVGMH